jgi:ABC-type multidrug transport system fused ATPase/permease subunit
MAKHDYKNSELPAGIFERIVARIHEEERLLSVKKRLLLFSTAIFISVGAFIPALSILRQEFAQSGFLQFLSLLFSDFGAVAANWQDFGLVLLESMPAMSIASFLLTALVFFWSFKHFVWAVNPVRSKSRSMVAM